MAEAYLRGDPLWGKPCLGYSVQARFDEASVALLAGLQTKIAAVPDLPELLWTPPATMHVSLFSVVPVRWPDEGKAALWDRLRAGVLKAVATFERPDHLAIGFQELCFTETALILSTADQAAPVRRLRAQLNALTVAAGLPMQTFNRTHVTLARPSRDERFGEARVAEVERIPATVEVAVEAIILIRELVYPSLEFEVLD